MPLRGRSGWTWHAGRGAIALAVMVAAADASASDAPAAQALFDEAKRDMTEGRWVEACPKLEESERLDPSIGTAFNLARCYEHVGRMASAWAAYRDAEANARVQGQTNREKVARERAAALAPKLPKLVISVKSTAAGLEIHRDGRDVGRGQWGSAVPIDPGEHRISASAPGRRTWESAVTIENVPKTITLDVPELDPEAVVATPPPIAASAQPGGSSIVTREPATSDPAETDSPGRGQRIGGLVVGTLGIVGLGVGAAFGLASKSKHDDAASHCNANDVCDPTGASDRHDAVKAGTASTIAFAAGGAAVLGGIILWATAPKGRPTQAHIEAAPMVGARASGLTLRGAW